MWRKRVSGRKTKHGATNPSNRFRAKCHNELRAPLQASH